MSSNRLVCIANESDQHDLYTGGSSSSNGASAVRTPAFALSAPYAIVDEVRTPVVFQFLTGAQSLVPCRPPVRRLAPTHTTTTVAASKVTAVDVHCAIESVTLPRDTQTRWTLLQVGRKVG